MSSYKIKQIIQNYKSLSNDIYKIEKKTLFLKQKKKELEEVLTDYFTQNNIEKLDNVSMVQSIRRGSLSQKYLQTILTKYYRNYYLSNKSRLSDTDITTFSARKTKNLLKFIMKNRESTKYYRIKVLR